MLVLRKQGLYCEAGGFYIDPKGAVDVAVVTHAHSDHARRGARRYVTARSGVELVRTRLGSRIAIEGRELGEKFRLGPVTVSFHGAGHILGSAQVRMELNGEVWVASGDYKRDFDPTCEPFEPVTCDTFVTEATFGTPAYQWGPQDVGREIFEWWEANRAAGRNSVVCAYSLGKTQRVLGSLRAFTDRPAWISPEATALTLCYRAEGVPLLASRCLSEAPAELKGELIIAPTSFRDAPWARALGENFETAFASGWMQTDAAGFGRGSGYDRGFTMSDHADWPALLRTIEETGARTVYVQHRGAGALVRELRKRGLDAHPESALAEPAQLSLFAAGGKGRVNA